MSSYLRNFLMQRIVLVIALTTPSLLFAKDKVVKRPAYVCGGDSFYPNTIVLQESATILGIRLLSRSWSLSSESHLVSEGKIYRMKKATVFKRLNGKVLSSEELDPSKHYKWEYDSLSAEFEPLDSKVKVFDFVEYEKSGFNTMGIRLDGKHYPFALGKPKPYPYAKDEPLCPITPKYGKAKYTVNLYRYDGTLDINHIAIFGVKNKFSDNWFDSVTKNSYEFDTSCSYVAPIGAPNPFQQFVVLMVPGFETIINVDETAFMASHRNIFKKNVPSDRLIQFEGPIADLQQVTFEERWCYPETFNKVSRDSLWDALQDKLHKIENNKAYSQRQKDFGRLRVESLYLRRYLECVNESSADLHDIHAVDLIFLKDGRSFYLVGDDTYLQYAHANHIGGVVTEWMEDYARAMNLAKRIRGMEAVPEAAFDTIPSIFRKELQAMNDSTRLAMERIREAAAEVKVMDTPDCTGEEFIERVVKDNPGVVLFFDLWATWCGPCMKGIKEMEPLKQHWAGRPIRFVYVTNESSPSNQWTKQIASMPGIHYRLPNSIWKAIPNLNGIPQYYIYDSQGKLFYEQTGFGGIDPLKKKIEEAISSQQR